MSDNRRQKSHGPDSASPQPGGRPSRDQVNPKKVLWDFVFWSMSGKHGSTREAVPGTEQPPTAGQQLG